MADQDFDVEAMLEAPYKKGTLTCHNLAQFRATVLGRSPNHRGSQPRWVFKRATQSKPGDVATADEEPFNNGYGR